MKINTLAFASIFLLLAALTKIKMFDNAAENSAGSIKLMFYYNLDNNEDTIGDMEKNEVWSLIHRHDFYLEIAVN